ncbi:Dipeptidyl-peptidase 5 [Microsporum canis]|uniref:Dipeptidyl-peptidase 5 n=1 Tax=Arthroderma otae (strain ATCC MYA-4605 / CBS 113480) TaxID=554155 RepID=DPP5_ARTOC|nr:dipeptidyl-peptidase 5 [Microsporum canis CBS 113480]C5FH88.1 RecName: Full=Dipeptidyl-peptidase 5; AltName: Full=Dipeptidyl-peptidase V; Short=DPP V; Short=DppV; Flags: Precursor [Microsporum canis CBS 113480]EEQ28807.1 dipeptidyl-peptidase 5 [Microsporum canis CBS 113480]
MAPAKWLIASLAFASTGLAFTPEDFISAPRRGEAIPDPKGQFAVFPVSKYNFDTKDRPSGWNLLNLKTGDISVLTTDADVSEITWLGEGTNLLYVNGTDSVKGGVGIWISDAKNFGNAYKAGSIPGAFQGFKLAKSGDKINFVGYGQSTTKGDLYNEAAIEKPVSSARIYDSLFVRHWDAYVGTQFNAVFSGALTKNGNKYSFDGKLKNLVQPVKYAESPYPPFGGSGDYDLSPDGKTVAFMSKAPELPKANLTTSYIFTVPHDGSKVAEPINKRNGPRTPHGIEGASSSPVFSPDSKRIAYLQMATKNYESDRRVIHIAEVGSNKPAQRIASNWDRSPESIKWSSDGRTLYVTAEEHATGKLFTLPSDARDNHMPSAVKHDGSVSAFSFVGSSKSVLITGNSLWSNALYQIATPGRPNRKLFYANEHDPQLKGLGPNDIEPLWVDGARTKIHSWIVKPTGFDKNKVYPLAFLIHGGPQGSWGDNWSTRWNPRVWADQGYVVIAPNPTGSTGFGQKLTDDITNDWGGAPYKDLFKIWEHVRDNLKYVDTDNGIAAGASFGGFMINWIQGQELGRKFKALVSHDGTFVGSSKIGTDELFFIEHDFNGTFFEARQNYDRWDCSKPEYVAKWSTPQLVVHSDYDFRLSVAEGVGLFNVLQEKGVPSRLLNFPDESHWVTKPENSLVWHQQVLGWINKFSGINKSNPKAIKLSDCKVEVIDHEAGSYFDY